MESDSRILFQLFRLDSKLQPFQLLHIELLLKLSSQKKELVHMNLQDLHQLIPRVLASPIIDQSWVVRQTSHFESFVQHGFLV